MVSEFKRLEAAARGRATPELAAVDAKIRSWPRTAQTDPYQPGLEAVAQALRAQLKDRLVLEAYNEFCSPSLPEALDSAVARGSRDITVITTMYTRGGVHSETEIPQLVEEARLRHPGVSIRYVWPFDLSAIGSMLAAEVRRVEAAAPA